MIKLIATIALANMCIIHCLAQTTSTVTEQPHNTRYLDGALPQKRFDLAFSGAVIQHLNKPSEYLSTGGGLKMDITFMVKNGFVFGADMSFWGNKLRKPFPLMVTRAQLPNPPTILAGIIAGKWFDRFNVQVELNYSLMNLTEKKLDQNDPEWVQLKGFSPGFIINYPIKIGKERLENAYGTTAVTSHNLNLHLGIRSLFFNLAEASGPMVECGIGYRITSVTPKNVQTQPR